MRSWSPIMMVVLFAGCSAEPVVRDNSSLIVVPGQGIPGLCAVGMTLSEVDQATRDLVVLRAKDDGGFFGLFKETGGYIGLVRSLGAVFGVAEKTDPIKEIIFYTQPFRRKGDPAFTMENTFKGFLKPDLFLGAEPLDRSKVVEVFGPLSLSTTNLLEASRMLQAGQMYSFTYDRDKEALGYYAHGLAFTLTSNRVSSITVFKPGEKQAAPKSRKRSSEGLPTPKTLSEAVDFVTDVQQVAAFQGPTSGSDYFTIDLPNGEQTDNWKVDVIFFTLFQPFGKEAVPALIELLGHEQDYVKYGASGILTQLTGRKDKRYDFRANVESNGPALQAWKAWWQDHRENPRLDAAPKRILEADEWEQVPAPSKQNPEKE